MKDNSGRPCNHGQPFKTKKAYLSHLQKYHKIKSRIAIINEMVTTNQCPVCLGVYKSKITAQNHLDRCIHRGRCIIENIRDIHIIIQPPSLCCPVCPASDDNNEVGFRILEDLQQHIKQMHLKQLVHDSHFEQTFETNH